MNLIFNSGSSGLKVKIFDKTDEVFSNTFSKEINNEEIFEKVIESIGKESFNKISKIGHRVVYGNEKLGEVSLLTAEVIELLYKESEHAPIHNPWALDLINLCTQRLPLAKNFAVFDNAFHQGISIENKIYALPYGYYENLGLQRNGFHGISFSYILQRLSTQNLNIQSSKVIVCHLGSGSSVCAIKNGNSFNHSFGFGPSENLMMATRSGEVDVEAIFFLKRKLGLKDEDIEQIINKESGLLGVSGYTADMKQLLMDYDSNNRAKLAIDMFVQKVVDYVAQFFVQLGGVDVIAFTGGIGSGSDKIRDMILSKLTILRIYFDKAKNKGQIDIPDLLDISDTSSEVSVFAIKTNEEFMINSLISKL